MRQPFIAVLWVALALMMVDVLARQPALAQNGDRRAGQQTKTVQPTPRTADGRVIWGPLPGHKGVWNARSHTVWDLDEPKQAGETYAASFAIDGFPAKLRSRQ